MLNGICKSCRRSWKEIVPKVVYLPALANERMLFANDGHGSFAQIITETLKLLKPLGYCGLGSLECKYAPRSSS